jgi:hypothetical protein
MTTDDDMVCEGAFELEIHHRVTGIGVRIPGPPPFLKHLRRPQFFEHVLRLCFAWPFLGYVRHFFVREHDNDFAGEGFRTARPALGSSRGGLITQRSLVQIPLPQP